jgi:hypothetical protein
LNTGGKTSEIVLLLGRCVYFEGFTFYSSRRYFDRCINWCALMVMLNGVLEIHLEGKADGRITGREYGTIEGERTGCGEGYAQEGRNTIY